MMTAEKLAIWLRANLPDIPIILQTNGGILAEPVIQ